MDTVSAFGIAWENDGLVGIRGGGVPRMQNAPPRTRYGLFHYFEHFFFIKVLDNNGVSDFKQGTTI